MIGEMFSGHAWLWPLAWQSTARLAVGLGGSFIPRRRPPRAHQLLLLALIAAAVVPAMSRVVTRQQWGLFVAERVTFSFDHRSSAATDDLQAVGQARRSGIADRPTTAKPPYAPPATTAAGPKLTRLVLVLWTAVNVVLVVRRTIQFLLGLWPTSMPTTTSTSQITRSWPRRALMSYCGRGHSASVETESQAKVLALLRGLHQAIWWRPRLFSSHWR